MPSAKNTAASNKIVFLSLLDLNLYLFRLPIMKALVQQGYDVIAMTPPGQCSHLFALDGIRFLPFEMDRKSLNPFKALGTIYQILGLLKIEKPDIVHSFTIKPNIYGAIAGFFAGVPRIINTVTGLGSFFIEQTVKSRLIRLLIMILYRLGFSLAQTVIFQNQDDLDYFLKWKLLSANKAFVIKSSGIDTTLWKPLAKADLPSAPVVVLMIGRLLVHKGVREYLQMAKHLKNKYQDGVQFWLVGDFYDGNSYAISPEEIDSYANANTIVYLGFRKDIQYLLSQSDIFVLPSYREGVPRTSIEAAAMGIPIVTTQAVGCREVVDEGENGFLVPVQDVSLLTDRVDQLIVDRQLRLKMGRASREKAVREFDVQAVIQQYLAVYMPPI